MRDAPDLRGCSEEQSSILQRFKRLLKACLPSAHARLGRSEASSPSCSFGRAFSIKHIPDASSDLLSFVTTEVLSGGQSQSLEDSSEELEAAAVEAAVPAEAAASPPSPICVAQEAEFFDLHNRRSSSDFQLDLSTPLELVPMNHFWQPLVFEETSTTTTNDVSHDSHHQCWDDDVGAAAEASATRERARSSLEVARSINSLSAWLSRPLGGAGARASPAFGGFAAVVADDTSATPLPKGQPFTATTTTAAPTIPADAGVSFSDVCFGSTSADVAPSPALSSSTTTTTCSPSSHLEPSLRLPSLDSECPLSDIGCASLHAWLLAAEGLVEYQDEDGSIAFSLPSDFQLQTLPATLPSPPCPGPSPPYRHWGSLDFACLPLGQHSTMRAQCEPCDAPYFCSDDMTSGSAMMATRASCQGR